MSGAGYTMQQPAGTNKKRASLEGKHRGATGEVQTEVFAKWVSMYLQGRDPKAEDILPSEINDCFRSGIVLTDLLHAVGSKKPGKVKKECKMKIHEINNLNIVFNSLAKEGVKVVNIGPEDIWDGNPKIILGLLWTIIYHFQILNGANFGEFDPKALGARVALLKWIQSRIPEMNVTNLGGDWRDGRCLSALVNCIASDFKMSEQIANPMDLPKDKAIGNLDNAMEIAANTLGIGRLLTPEQVADDGLDEKAMITYLSLYAVAKKPKKSKTVGKKAGWGSTAARKKKEKAAGKTSIADPVVFFEAPAVSAGPPVAPEPTAEEKEAEMLGNVNDLFDAMDVDSNGRLKKLEVIEFLREFKPLGTTTANIYTILGLDKLSEIDRPTFVKAFTEGKLDINNFDLRGLRRRAQQNRDAALAAAAKAAADEEKENAAEERRALRRKEEAAVAAIAFREAEERRAAEEADADRLRQERRAKEAAELAAKEEEDAKQAAATARARQEAAQQREEEEAARKAAAQQKAADDAARQKEAADKAATVKAAEMALKQKAAADRAAKEKAASDQQEADKAAKVKAAQDKAAADLALKQQRAADEKAAADQRLAADKAAKDQAAADNAAAEQAAAAAAASAAAASAASSASSLPPPLERAADWRVYQGVDLGGRCRIKVFFSTTTSSQKIRGDTEKLKTLLEKHNYHKRPDFEQFIPVDIEMEKSFRDKMFAKAGTRITPMLFVDDEYIGGWEEVAELDEAGQFERIMEY